MIIEKQNTPLVSVILCVYNRKDILERALNSVIKQTFKDYELIIVDDGSTDEVEKLIFPYLKKHQNFKYIRHSNCGLPLSRNKGILIAQGQYITFIDSDDEYKKEHLEQMVFFMKENPDVDLIHSSCEVIGNEDDMWLVDARDKTKLIHIKDCVVGPTFFGKKEVFIEMDGFKELSYAEDFDFYNRLISSGKFKIHKLNEKTYIYYRNVKNSITNSVKKACANPDF